jgi:hypothetical protein
MTVKSQTFEDRIAQAVEFPFFPFAFPTNYYAWAVCRTNSALRNNLLMSRSRGLSSAICSGLMLLSGPHILFILCRVKRWWQWLRPGQTLGHGAHAFLDALFFWHGFGESYCQPHFENSLIVVLVRPPVALCGSLFPGRNSYS